MRVRTRGRSAGCTARSARTGNEPAIGRLRNRQMDGHARSCAPGRFVLTGPAYLPLVPGLGDSLAGLIATDWSAPRERSKHCMLNRARRFRACPSAA